MFQTTAKCGIVRAALGALLAFSVSCSHQFTSAPDDARVRLAFPDGREALQEDTIAVVAELRLETGDLAGQDWRIDLSVDAGRFADSVSVTAVRLTTGLNGSAGATYYAPADTGWVRFRAVAGSVEAVDSIRISARSPSAP